MKYILEHILTSGFQFWEPPRGALNQSNFDFFSLTPLLNTLRYRVTHNTGHLKILAKFKNMHIQPKNGYV